MLRPRPARWFEAVVARDEVSQLLQALAVHAEVEIEPLGAPGASEAGLSELLDRAEELRRRYARHWPPPGPTGSSGSPRVVLQRALDTLGAWAAAADPLVAELEATELEDAGLRRLQELLVAAEDDVPDLGALAAAGPSLLARLFCDAGRARLPPGSGVLVRRWSDRTQDFVLLVGDASEVLALEPGLLGAGARPVPLPGVPASTEPASAWVEARRGEIGERAAAARTALAALHDRVGLAGALADLRRLQWFASSVPALPHTRNLAVVSGWTSDVAGDSLQAALEAGGVAAVLHFPAPPADRDAPVVLANPRWLQAFEVFAGLMGTPSKDGVDPSPVLALVAPLLFGFMFGDVGQGAVLVGAGLILGRRHPPVRLLVGGGVAAMLFGALYGSVFGREDLLPALWLHPLEEPLPLLRGSLVLGAALLAVGLGLDAVGALLRGELGRWLALRGGLVVAYVGVLSALCGAPAAVAAVSVSAGLIGSALGAAGSAASRRALAAASGVGRFVEALLQVLINTLSFARVGAFALAHAGLSAAVISLADGVRSPAGALLVLALGNALVLLLEGLVVAIQTTRLILFEFFLRFLRAEGRPFQRLRFPAGLDGAAPEEHP